MEKKGVTYFLIEGEEPEIKVIVKRDDQIIKERHTTNKEDAEFIRTCFVNEFWGKPMRYALRNQQKIKEALGDDLLVRIKQSLKEAFAIYKDIEQHITPVEGEPFPILMVGDSGNTSNMVAFYVIKRKWDVYTLAFKEFIG